MHTTTLREQLIHDLQLAGMSERTQEAYVRAVRQLAAHFRQPPDQLSETQLRDYFLFIKNEKRFSVAALKIAHSGIKFFYTHTAPREWATLLKLRVPRQKSLPDVLTAALRLLERQQPLVGRGGALAGYARQWRAVCPVAQAARTGLPASTNPLRRVWRGDARHRFSAGEQTGLLRFELTHEWPARNTAGLFFNFARPKCGRAARRPALGDRSAARLRPRIAHSARRGLSMCLRAARIEDASRGVLPR